MDNQIQVFNSPQFGDVRIVLGEDNEPCFCLKDVCNVLGLRSNDVNQRLDKGVVSTHPLCTSGGTQQVKFVNEDGLYDVILDSRKPEAKAFRKWVTSDVLPSIRKNGAYMTDEALEKALLSPDFGIRLFEKLKEERQARYALEVQQREQQALLLQKDERIEELDKENKKLAESRTASSTGKTTKVLGLSMLSLSPTATSIARRSYIPTPMALTMSRITPSGHRKVVCSSTSGSRSAISYL